MIFQGATVSYRHSAISGAMYLPHRSTAGDGRQKASMPVGAESFPQKGLVKSSKAGTASGVLYLYCTYVIYNIHTSTPYSYVQMIFWNGMPT